MAYITPSFPLMVPPIVSVDATAVGNVLKPYPILQTPSIAMSPTGPNLVYPDVNKDNDLHRQVVDFYWNKLTEDWLRYYDLFKYLHQTGNGRVDLIRTVKEHSSEGFTPEKRDYIMKFVINKKDLHYLLDQYATRFNIKWWDLSKYASEVRAYIEKRMKHFLKKEILKVARR